MVLWESQGESQVHVHSSFMFGLRWLLWLLGLVLRLVLGLVMAWPLLVVGRLRWSGPGRARAARCAVRADQAGPGHRKAPQATALPRPRRDSPLCSIA